MMKILSFWAFLFGVSHAVWALNFFDAVDSQSYPIISRMVLPHLNAINEADCPSEVQGALLTISKYIEDQKTNPQKINLRTAQKEDILLFRLSSLVVSEVDVMINKYPVSLSKEARSVNEWTFSLWRDFSVYGPERAGYFSLPTQEENLLLWCHTLLKGVQDQVWEELSQN